MFAEQETYREWLLSQPSEEILNHTCILRQPTAAGAVPNGRRAVLTAD